LNKLIAAVLVFFNSTHSELGRPTGGEGSAIISSITTSYLFCEDSSKGINKKKNREKIVRMDTLLAVKKIADNVMTGKKHPVMALSPFRVQDQFEVYQFGNSDAEQLTDLQ
jgi:hypothetical protein